MLLHVPKKHIDAIAEKTSLNQKMASAIKEGDSELRQRNVGSTVRTITEFHLLLDYRVFPIIILSMTLP